MLLFFISFNLSSVLIVSSILSFYHLIHPCLRILELFNWFCCIMNHLPHSKCPISLQQLCRRYSRYVTDFWCKNAVKNSLKSSVNEPEMSKIILINHLVMEMRIVSKYETNLPTYAAVANLQQKSSWFLNIKHHSHPNGFYWGA